MQIKGKLIEVGGQINGTPYIAIHMNHETEPNGRPVRVPCPTTSDDDVRELARHLYREVQITITPIADLGIDLSRTDATIVDHANDLALAMRDYRVQPGAPELAEVVARLAQQQATIMAALVAQKADAEALTDYTRKLHEATASLNSQIIAVREDVGNIKTDVQDVEEQLLDKHAADFHAGATMVPDEGARELFKAGEHQHDPVTNPIGALNPPSAFSAAFGHTIANPGSIASAAAPEPGVDTQLTPTWVEPLLAEIAATENGGAGHPLRLALEPVVRALDTTLGQTIGGTGIRDNVWMIYRPLRELAGLDVIALRDGVVAVIRTVFADAGDTMRAFQVLAYNDGPPEAGVDRADFAPPPGAVRLPIENDYAEVWITNAERMVECAGYQLTEADALSRHHAVVEALMDQHEDGALTPAEHEEVQRVIDHLLEMTDEEVVARYRDAWPPLEGVIDYLGGMLADGTRKGMARIWATWSGREVRLIAPGEPLEFEAIETPESVLRAQTARMEHSEQLAAVHGVPWDGNPATAFDGLVVGLDGQPVPVDPLASTPYAGAPNEDGTEAVTQPPEHPMADAEGFTYGQAIEVERAPELLDHDEAAAERVDRRRADADSPPPVLDPDVEPNYWGDGSNNGNKTKSRKKRRR